MTWLSDRYDQNVATKIRLVGEGDVSDVLNRMMECIQDLFQVFGRLAYTMYNGMRIRSSRKQNTRVFNYAGPFATVTTILGKTSNEPEMFPSLACEFPQFRGLRHV